MHYSNAGRTIKEASGILDSRKETRSFDVRTKNRFLIPQHLVRVTCYVYVGTTRYD